MPVSIFASLLCLLAWTLLPIPGLAMEKPTLVIHGEYHRDGDCILQRSSLARAASLKQIVLVSENVAYDAVDNGKQAKKFFLTDDLQSIYGLESEFSHAVAEYLLLKDLYRNALVNFQSAPKEKEGLHSYFVLSALTHVIEGTCSFPIVSRILNCPLHTQSISKIYDLDIDDLPAFVKKDATQLFESFESEVLHNVHDMSKSLGLSMSPKDLPEKEILDPVYKLESFATAQEGFLIIGWRNYFMLHRLKTLLGDELKNNAKDIHAVLGLRHVDHFKYVLERDYPMIAEKYQIRVSRECDWDEFTK